MANALYTKFVESYMTQAANQVDLDADTIKAVLIDAADYTVDIANHDFLDDVPAGARVATGTLANKTVTARVFDADDLTLTSVTGDPSEAIILYKDTGVEATSRLIAYIDTATGLPVTPNGANINIVWDSGANKIFKL